ncbi:MAG TPA: efflux RND transporter periplasmic adaptor subunit [Ghiorsea sp.]|nr:efflux RND transporter periplasmic adaptor subunit [Ghiorsea sp.]HIP06670.1 efflux RND transporter periplasmic adaptor subunit [Mariprofundaceae bacterium]
MNTLNKKTTIAAMLLASLSLAACTDDDAYQTAAVQTTQAQAMTVQAQQVPEYYTTSGSVASDHKVSISAQTSGYIKVMNVREGDKVKAGQVLVQIDPTDAKQAYLQAKADLKDAKADLQRFQELLAAGAIGSQKVDKAKLRYDVATSNVARAKNQLSYAEVRSPVDGVIVEKRLSVGDLASPGAPILSIEDPNSLLVATYVTENFISKIHEGDTVDITIASLHKTFAGTVRQVVQAADAVSHQFLVKVALKTDIDIHPGMFAQAGFRVGEREAILIPQDVMQSRSGLHAVYVLDGQGIAQYRLIRLGQTHGDSVEVVAGLQAGDTIVWQGNPTLKTGMKVQMVNGK